MAHTESIVDVARSDGAWIFTFSPCELLDLDSMQAVRERVAELIKTEPRLRVVLDLGEVMLLTSDGIAMIVSLRNAIRPCGAEIHIANVSPESRVVFEHLRLNHLVRIYDRIEDAVAAFG